MRENFRSRTLAAGLAILLLLAGCAAPARPDTGGQPPPSEATASPEDTATPEATASPEGTATPGPAEEAIGLLNAMSLEEKLGQMIIAGVEGQTAGDKDKRMINEEHVGGVIFYKNNIKDAAGLTAYVNRLKAWNKGSAAPLFLSTDQEGGIVSRLPELEELPDARDIGDADDPAYAAAIGGILGRSCALMGINMDYAPVLDINSNPDNPVIGVRSYGTTPERVSQAGLQVMAGIREQGVIPVVKHFPGHGDTSVDSHLELPVVNKSLSELKAFEWVPFADAIRGGADAVMIAHILFPQIDKSYPASLSRTVITDELRGTLGFGGVVMTDDLTMGAIAEHYGIGEAAVRSVKAGSDILLVAHGYDNVDKVLASLKASVGKGGLTEERINESVARILTLKLKYGLSDEAVEEAPDTAGLNAEIRETVE